MGYLNFAGPSTGVAVPTLWDRFHARVVSNDSTGIALDLATRFRHLAVNRVDTYPVELRAEIDRWAPPGFGELDNWFARNDYLIGGVLTQADVRLWVTLVRHEPGLRDYPNLWRYARTLYRIPAFRVTTRPVLASWATVRSAAVSAPPGDGRRPAPAVDYQEGALRTRRRDVG